jgi:predicted dehydrogenase
MSTSDTVRIGIIGAGIVRAHIGGYQQVPGAHVAAVCDLQDDKARQIIEENALNAQPFTDFRAMLDMAQLDAVSVCLPNALHHAVVTDCLRAGLHVLCEKPLAINSREAREIARVAGETGKQCMVGQVLRFRPDALLFKQLSASGEMGEFYYASAGSLRTRGIPGWGGWFTTQAQSGGGALIDMGVHLLDLAWWLAGCPRPLSATGVTHAAFGPQKRGLGTGGARNEDGIFDVEDLAVAQVRFESGLSIHIEIAWAINAAESRQWCHLYGTAGGLAWGDEPSVVRDENGAPIISHPALPPRDQWRSLMWAGECRHFIECVRNGHTPDPDAHQGVAMMTMLDAIYASAREGREVLIAE